jgi:hypothetical protein
MFIFGFVVGFIAGALTMCILWLLQAVGGFDG